jgi:hypothetical protein
MTVPSGLNNEFGADQQILSMTDDLSASIEGISPTPFGKARVAELARVQASLTYNRNSGEFPYGS